MGNLFYILELAFILIAAGLCAVNNFINGCDLVRAANGYSVGLGIAEITLSIALVGLAIAYYQFYKLVED